MATNELIEVGTCVGVVKMDVSNEACLKWGHQSGSMVGHPLGWVAHIVGVGTNPKDGNEKVIWVRNCLTGEVFSPISPMLMRKTGCCSRSSEF